MNFRSCRHEHDVQAAAMSGRWPAPVAQHARDCASCRDMKRVVEALQAPIAPAPRAVDASALWACGRHARRISTEARISTIVAVAQIGSVAGVLSVLIALASSSGVWAALWPAIWPQSGTWLFAAAGVVAAGAGFAWWASTASRSDASHRPSG